MKICKSKLKKKLREISITKRLILVFVFSILIPISMIGIITALFYRNSTYRKMETMISQSLSAYNLMIEQDMKAQKNFSYKIVSNEKVIQMLEKNESYRLLLHQALMEELEIDGLWSEACENIVITDRNNQVRDGWSTDSLTEDFFRKTASALEKNKKNDCWSETVTLRRKRVLVFTKKIYSIKTTENCIGYLHLVYDEDRFFQKIYDNFEVGNESDIFLLDDKYKYIACQKDKEKIGETKWENDADNIREYLEQGKFIKKEDGKKSFYVCYPNKIVNGYLVAEIPCNYIDADITNTVKLLIILCIIMIGISIIPIILVGETITHPIRKLSGYMDKVVEGNYNVSIEEDSNDEIGRLIRNCENTVQHIIHVMDENQKKSILQRKLELQRLQAQINPHFLFNTLNSFKYIAMINNVPMLEEGIGAFCGLLRETIISGEELITIEQEIYNIKNYCKVQNFRYAGMFELQVILDEAAKEKKIPRMILQPFVENCLVHGMKEEVLLFIIVDVSMKDSQLIICIKDNGKGIEKELTKKIMFNGIGMSNVKERLKMIYGDGVNIQVKSEKDIGTEITILIDTQ